jgi:hypothetical protein
MRRTTIHGMHTVKVYCRHLLSECGARVLQFGHLLFQARHLVVVVVVVVWEVKGRGGEVNVESW